ncbi:MAG: HAMP domain-containing sensor histidine kinase [Myxococcota bacterium]
MTTGLTEPFLVEAEVPAVEAVRRSLLRSVAGGGGLAAAAVAVSAVWQVDGPRDLFLAGVWCAVVLGLVVAFVLNERGRRQAGTCAFMVTAIPAVGIVGLLDVQLRALLILQLGTALIILTAVKLLDRTSRRGVVLLAGHYVVVLGLRVGVLGAGPSEPSDLLALIGGGGVALLVLGDMARRTHHALLVALEHGQADRLALRATNGALTEARDHALAASNAKSVFLANMSHELRTPLNAIVGYAELLREEAPSDQWDRDLGSIRGAGRHLLSIIDKILDLAKVEAGQLQLAHAPVDVAVLAHQVCEQLAPLFVGPVRLVPPHVAQVGDAWLDETRVRQVLTNLVGNAAKFTSQGEVRVVVGGDDCRVWVEVTDTGPGISPGLASRLFEPFVQGRHQQGGTGLGLASTRQLVTLMGGGIDIGPAGPSGTRASVRLPRDLRHAVRQPIVLTETSEPSLLASVP